MWDKILNKNNKDAFIFCDTIDSFIHTLNNF